MRVDRKLNIHQTRRESNLAARPGLGWHEHIVNGDECLLNCNYSFQPYSYLVHRAPLTCDERIYFRQNRPSPEGESIYVNDPQWLKESEAQYSKVIKPPKRSSSQSETTPDIYELPPEENDEMDSSKDGKLLFLLSLLITSFCHCRQLETLLMSDGSILRA